MFRDGRIYTQAPEDVFKLAAVYGLPSQAKSGAKLDDVILKTINKYSDVKFESIEEAAKNLPKVQDALEARRVAKGLPPIELERALPVPYILGSQPSGPRALAENGKGFMKMLDDLQAQVLAKWGEQTKWTAD